jgi:hypothetical protein
MLGAMAGWSQAAPTPYPVSWYLTPEVVLALVAGIVGSAPVVPLLTDRVGAGRGELLLVVSITQVALGAFTPFIYFRF